MMFMRLQDGTFRKKLKRRNWAGNAHFLTFSCFRRRAFLSKDRTRRWVVEEVNAAIQEHPLVVWAWVIMPEHMHLLVCPTAAEYEVGPFLKAIKLPVTRKAVAYVKRNDPEFLVHLAHPRSNGKTAYRFWQRGPGYDRNLTSTDEVWEKIEYIHWNPVRRGLVSLPSEWVWSSAAYYARRGESAITLDTSQLPFT